MKKLFIYADEYIKNSSWKDFALIKFCLCSMGLLLGIAVPKNGKKAVAALAVFVFIATYIPLMLKFFGIVKEYEIKE